MLTALKQRFPTFQQILAVYGVVALLIHGWTLMWFLWRLPSWLYFLKIGEILSVFAYSMCVNLLESISMMVGLLLFSFALPKRWFRNVFLSHATLLAILGLISLTIIASHISSNDDSYPTTIVQLIPFIILLVLDLTFLIGRIAPVRKLTEDMADRATIFSYIFLPIGFLSFLIVVIRNVYQK